MSRLNSSLIKKRSKARRPMALNVLAGSLLALFCSTLAQSQCESAISVRFSGNQWEVLFKERVLADLQTEFGLRDVGICVLEVAGPAADVTLNWVDAGALELLARTARPGLLLPRTLELQRLPLDSHSLVIAVAVAELLRASGLRPERRLEQVAEAPTSEETRSSEETAPLHEVPALVDESGLDASEVQDVSSRGLEWSLTAIGSAEYVTGGLRLFGSSLVLHVGGARVGLETEIGFGVARSESGQLGTLNTRAGWLSVAAGVDLVRGQVFRVRLQGGPRAFLAEFQGRGQSPLVVQSVVRPALSIAAGMVLVAKLGALRLRTQVDVGGVLIGAGATENGVPVAAIEGMLLRGVIGAGAAW